MLAICLRGVTITSKVCSAAFQPKNNRLRKKFIQQQVGRLEEDAVEYHLPCNDSQSY